VKANGDTYDMMAAPVDVKNEKINHVPNYGTGFAPYFLSLGLFVGALLISIVYPLKEPANRPSSGMGWFLGKFTVLTTVGIIQSLIAAGILLFGLGLEVESVPLFLLSTIITSLTFLALIQMLVTILGDPGRFVAIIILILQLTTSAGTFPLELIPRALQPISALLPMTYSVAVFKAVISSGDFGFMWQNLFILLGYFLVFIVLTSIFFMGLFKKQYRKTAEA
jgi:putative membrane protein